MAFTLKQSLGLAAAPPMLALAFRSLAATWRFSESGVAGLSPKRAQPAPRIYAYFHEYLIGMVGSYRDQAIHPFASRSFDGELISRVARRMGYLEVARGSSSRGGAQALLESLAFLKTGEHVSITVDGPRGPRRQAQEGAVKLAQLSGASIVPVAMACSFKFRLRSWDRMLLPLPFARCEFIFGSEISCDPASSAELELKKMQGAMLALSEAADIL
jgi:lysophospholipid acyltransferase (LPLAT)-like uncharacterized protein